MPHPDGHGHDRDINTIYYGGGEMGKSFPHDLTTLSLFPNNDMVREIHADKNRLRNTTIFFIFLNKESLPSHIFFDSWLNYV